jgi:glycosyltransferase involved in cell wall biosynthesis
MISSSNGSGRAHKILIVAPNASSRFGGESFLPLKYFEILRRRGLPAKLIAHARNRADLTATLGPFLQDIMFVEDTLWHRVIWQTGRHFPNRIRELIFGAILALINSHYQAKLIRNLIEAGEVDIIHEPIPVSPRTPSSIYGFGIPVVIGPMNGGMNYPPGYEDYESVVTRKFVGGARSLAKMMNRLIPGKRRAAVLLVANARTRAALPFLGHPNVVELVENGVDQSIWTAADRQPRAVDNAFRLVFMGRLVDWKAVDITLDAISRARTRNIPATLDILGDGPERARLEARAAEPDLAGAVKFHGLLPQSSCRDVARRMDALIINSVHECGGAVVLEAMSLGLPVIASDWGGPADYIDDSCGIVVHPVPRASFADRLATAIERLAGDPALSECMGRAGEAKIRAEYDWEKKVDRIVEIYQQVSDSTIRPVR